MAANGDLGERHDVDGSIGVGATIATFPRTLAAVGVPRRRYRPTKLSGAFETTRPMSDASKG